MSASPGERRRGPQNMNDGTRDIGNTQAPVLLFRGLDPLSGPQAIAQAMKTSSGPGKEGAKGMKRIILIKDKVTMASWGFTFVEFIDVAVRRFLFPSTDEMKVLSTVSFPLLVGFRGTGCNNVSSNSPFRVPYLGPSSCCVVCSS